MEGLKIDIMKYYTCYKYKRVEKLKIGCQTSQNYQKKSTHIV